jgi:hypothetical protein
VRGGRFSGRGDSPYKEGRYGSQGQHPTSEGEGTSSLFQGGCRLGADDARDARRAGRRRDREDERLLRAFRELSARRGPGVSVAVHEVKELAKVSGLGDGLDRLLRKGHIVEHPGRWDWFVITEEGRREATGPRRRGRRAFGG